MTATGTALRTLSCIYWLFVMDYLSFWLAIYISLHLWYFEYKWSISKKVIVSCQNICQRKKNKIEHDVSLGIAPFKLISGCHDSVLTLYLYFYAFLNLDDLILLKLCTVFVLFNAQCAEVMTGSAFIYSQKMAICLSIKEFKFTNCR